MIKNNLLNYSKYSPKYNSDAIIFLTFNNILITIGWYIRINKQLFMEGNNMKKLNNFKARTLLFSGIILVILIGFHKLARTRNIIPSDKNKALVKRLIEEGYNKRDLTIVDEIIATNYVEHTNGVIAESSDVVKQTITWLAEESPDFKLSIEDMITEGDQIALRWIYQGKNIKFDKQVNLEGIFICRFSNAKIVEGWQLFDNLTRYQQLGYTLTPPRDSKENK